MVVEPNSGGCERRRKFFLDFKARLVECLRVYVRYDLPDDDGTTRRQRNESLGEYTPEFVIPSAGKYLWNLYHALSKSVSRVREGYYHVIPPSEYRAWLQITDNLVYPSEYDILLEMDIAFCDEANKELESNRSKREEQRRREIEAAQQKGRTK